jgi:hypothetical protein
MVVSAEVLTRRTQLIRRKQPSSHLRDLPLAQLPLRFIRELTTQIGVGLTLGHHGFLGFVSTTSAKSDHPQRQ